MDKITKQSEKHNITYDYRIDYKEFKITVVTIIVHEDFDECLFDAEIFEYINQYAINGEILYICANDFIGVNANTFEFKDEADFNRFILENC